MAMDYPAHILRLQVGVHLEVVTKVNRILDFMREPKDDSIDDIVKTLQKATKIQRKIRDAVENFGIDVAIIGKETDVNPTLEYLQNRQKSGKDILAFVCLYIDDDEPKNTVWLNSDFPCPVVFDFCKTGAVHVLYNSAIDKACNAEFGLGTAAVRKLIAKLKDEFDDYSSNLRKLISIYDNVAKLNMYVKEAFKENTGLEKVKSIARSVWLEGYPGIPYSVTNALKVREYKSTLAKDILKEIGQNVKYSIGLKIKKDIHELLHTTAFDVVGFDVSKHPDSQYVLVNIFLWVYDVLLDKLHSLVATFFKPQDINSNIWRDNIAEVIQTSLNDHKNEIVRRLDEECQSICRTLAKTLKQEFQETQNQSLPIIPNSTKGYSGCKLTAASYGTDELGRKVIGLRAENFDHIHLTCEKGMDIVFDQKTIKESTAEMREVDAYMDRQQVNNVRISFDRRRYLNQIVRKHTTELMEKHSNLITISTSPVTSRRGAIEEDSCIVIYCYCKGIIPLGEPKFPRKLDNIPVDVREGHVYFAVAAREFHDPLRLGCSIGTSGDSKAGSIGVFVKEVNTANQYGLLTCSHVLLSPQEFTDPRIRQKIRDSTVPTDVVQPSYLDDLSNITCGRLIDAKFGNVNYQGSDTGVDCAYVKMTSRIPQTLKFPSVTQQHHEAPMNDEDLRMGPPILDMDVYTTSQKVRKFGRTSELTEGEFDSSGAIFQPNLFSGLNCQQENQRTCLKNLYRITVERGHVPFLEQGDSGASVYIENKTENKVHVIGLAVGGLCNGREFFVTPISAVLDYIVPPIEILRFP